MITKQEVQQEIADLVNSYPALYPLYNVSDPRIIQHLDAIATMIAMLSQQIDVAQSEPFSKKRDATVLADAAMRGIIRKARSGRISINAFNNNSSSYTIETGRIIIDSSGNPYVVETAALIPSNASASFEAVQVSYEIITHVVSNSQPFYDILIPDSDGEDYLTSISVSDNIGDYEYRERYVNTLIGDRVFNVEADDRQNLYVRFGFDGVIGTQPQNGTEITLKISRSIGEISPEPGSPMDFDYISGPADINIDLSVGTVIDIGQNPPDMITMRDMIKYPSIYDHNAVFLGEFEFLVRREFSNLRYLSIWNELIEETARAPSVDNINTLFIACLSSSGVEPTLTEVNPLIPVAPTFVAEIDLTETQIKIRSLIKNADDSYRVKFYTPVRSEIVVSISATVSTSYVASDVQSQITEAILIEYGETSPASKRGGNKPLYKRVYALLREKVQAVTDPNADIHVTIADTIGDYRPELWRYVSPASLTVTVTTENILSPSWGG